MRRFFVPVALILTATLGVFALGPAVSEAGGGGHGQCLPREAADGPVVIRYGCFSPTVLYVETGETVEWQQMDSVPHNVTLLDGEVAGGDRGLYAGDSVSHVFETPGVYAYYCTVHPMMLGVIVAGDPASAGLGANLRLQIPEQHSQATTGDGGGQVDAFKGSGPGGGFRWAEAAIGAGLFGGLVVGLGAVGGRISIRRGR
jgi:plastocyanin